MADDKNKLGFQERNRVADDQEYEVWPAAFGRWIIPQAV